MKMIGKLISLANPPFQVEEGVRDIQFISLYRGRA